jgi:tetratricopeptide (TPR) repeat protein
MMKERRDVLALDDPLRVARAAQRSAHYDAALGVLEGCEDWSEELAEKASLLKAETLGRRDPSEALAYLASVDDLFVSAEGRFGRDIECGRLQATVRDFTSAESYYADARVLAGAVPDGAHTMAYHDLRMRWLRRECDPDAPEVALAIAHPDPSIASAAYAYRGWLHAGNRDYDAHIADLVRAVSYAARDGDEAVDVATLATSIHALAQVAFETANAGGIAAARMASDALAWTPDVRVQQFATIRAFGWDAFMRGNPGRAQWAFKEARSIAPSTTWRIMGHLDRAYVARMSGNEFWALEELAQADALAFEMPWESSYGEERQVLVTLAVLHAPADAARAQRYAALYSRIGTESINPALAVHGDRRAHALARYAQGRIEQTLGRREAAVVALREAFEIFDTASFHFRAVLAATALAELTGEDRWRDAALAHAGSYPDCPLVAVAEHAGEREQAMPPQLSPVQRQIARALWNGVDLAELSSRFSRSLYRIQRQVDAVYAAFGVTTRTALHDEARTRGLA